jgi:deaminated glutathione amidase
MRIAAVQLSSQDDVNANLSAARREVERAQDAGARVVVLPEGFAFLGAEAAKGRVAERLSVLPNEDGPIARALRSWSRDLGLVIVAAGLPEISREPARPFNTSAVFADGELVARYHKIHVFDVDLPDGTRRCESNSTTPGDEVVVFDEGPMRAGLAICYDLRFPELFRKERQLGCQVILLGAAFTRTTGQAHWHTLIRARAIETQCYVVAAGQCGEHPGGHQSFGHSLIVDPWGDVLAELAEGSGVIVADVDLARVQSIRAQMPLESHRRL